MPLLDILSWSNDFRARGTAIFKGKVNRDRKPLDRSLQIWHITWATANGWNNSFKHLHYGVYWITVRAKRLAPNRYLDNWRVESRTNSNCWEEQSPVKGSHADTRHGSMRICEQAKCLHTDTWPGSLNSQPGTRSSWRRVIERLDGEFDPGSG